MERRLEMMQQLSGDLHRLFELCGVEAKKVEPVPAASVYRLLEYVVADKALLTYLEELGGQTLLAIRKMEESNQECMRLLAELAQERFQSQQLREALQQHGAAAEDRRLLVQNLIENADRLDLYLDNLCREEDRLALELAQQQRKQIRAMLQGIGVEILESEGVFDCCEQCAVGTEYTQNEDLVDCIAKTVRPGYRDGGRILRPQEVIVYSAFGM